MEPTAIKDIVLNARKPVVIRNLRIPWQCFDQPFPDWLRSLDASNPCSESGFQFDCGPLRNGSRPQWERTRGKIRMTMGDFYRDGTDERAHFEDNWASYSYRCVGELPDECRPGPIDFGSFGFPDVREDVSFWIGSRGAHTPCHYDTYGCNIVVQVHGRKSWLLFPPDAILSPTRVPYEESSVYCKENFYSPDAYSKVIGVENDAYHLILEPGMALVVPPKWWHFVENLECSLNFNTWIQLESDTEEQISECLTRLIVQDKMDGLTADNLRHIINPNELPTIESSSQEELQHTLEYLLEQQASNKRQRTSSKRHPFGYLPQSEYDQLLNSCINFVLPVKKLESYEFFQLMKRNSLRYDPSLNRSSDDEEENQRAVNVINLSCQPDLIEMVKSSLR